MKNLSRLLAVTALTFSAGALMAQVDLDATDAAGDPGTDVDVFIDLTGDGSTSTPSWRLLYPTDQISAVDASQCDASNPDISGDTAVNCSAGCGGFTPPAGFDCVSYILLPANVVANAPVATTQFGPITFTLSNTADIGNFDVVFDDIDLVGTATPGTITVNAPAGGFYGSNPVPGGTLDLGFAVVNVQATTSPFTVTNASADAFSVNGFQNVSSPEVSTPAGPFGVPGSGSFTFDGGDAITCTPDAVGPNNGTFEVTHDAAGGAASPVMYNYTCLGLAPNVQVAPTSLMLNGAIGGTPPTASFDVSNPDIETASDAQNASATDTDESTEISISDGLTDNVISVAETDSVTVSCSTAAPGIFNETITVAWDDPVNGGQATQDVTVTCNIANVAPGYTSAPAPGSTLAFGQIVNGQTSAAATIDIGNGGSVGTGTQSELEITGAVLSDSTNYSFSPDPFTATLAAQAANGDASIDVFCTPQSIGDFSGETLTVQTNDGDQVYNLSCEGTSNAQVSVSPPSAQDGTLNLGSVAPGTTTTGQLTLSNTGSDPLEVSCTLSDDNGGVITAEALPDAAILPPDFVINFEGTPPEIGSVEETLECFVETDGVQIPGAAGGTGPTFTTRVIVSGRVLAIPTLSQWGLLLMMLSLLLVGGFAARRVMG